VSSGSLLYQSCSTPYGDYTLAVENISQVIFIRVLKDISNIVEGNRDKFQISRAASSEIGAVNSHCSLNE
jgi:Ulp1 family protease